MDTAKSQINFIIIDDDDLDSSVIEAESRKFSFLQKAGTFNNPIEALDFISTTKPDLVFLDIEMPGMTGIEFLKRNPLPSAIIVFTTSHPEFALEGYEFHVLDYLLKPVSSERFSSCALRLQYFFEMQAKSYAFDSAREKDFIIIKQGYDKYKIFIPDILYLEAMKDYTRISTPEKQYLVLTTLNAMTEKLPADTFIRIHRSYVVNKHKVDAVQKNKLRIQSYEIPIGKLYKDAFTF